MERLGKKVAVWGLGKTGEKSALFLARKGFRVFAWDQGNSPALNECAGVLEKNGIAVEIGSSQSARLWDCDWILISPGIKPSSPVYLETKKRGIPVYSEIEVASRYCASPNILAVTGSAGKTTVTTLLSRVFARAGRRVITCGNIGAPWIGEVDGIGPDDFVVMELSSFQLYHCDRFKPKVGILLNISPNHLDWHCDMADYVAAKLNLFRSQGAGDYAVLRGEDEKRFFPEFRFCAKKIYLDQNEASSGAGAVTVNPNERVVGCVSGLFGIGPDISREVFSEFTGIEHRLEKAETIEGVTFVNDSKCTTPLSLAWGLEKYPDKKIVLIAGGRAKSKDFQGLKSLLEKKVKHAVLIGEARAYLREAWDGACPLGEAGDLSEAVRQAFRAASAGDAVLFSPACASFDMFKNYEDRGRIFKETVRLLGTEIGVR
jgi:UDP-N-acetylmuramoylalanine--D-glutamate ligase